MAASFSEREPADYRALAWLPDDRFVVGTRSGELLLFKKEELIGVIGAGTGAAGGAGRSMTSSTMGVAFDVSVNAIVPIARGFFTANDDVSAGPQQGLTCSFSDCFPGIAVFEG